MHLVSHVSLLDSNEITNVSCWTLVTLTKETIVNTRPYRDGQP